MGMLTKKQAVGVPQATPYQQHGRLSLLLIFIFSCVNMLLLPLANSVLLFSSYYPMLLSLLGTAFYREGAGVGLLLLMNLIGLVLLIPYLVCFLLSRRKVGWLIVGAVLFAGETVPSVIDAVSMMLAGDLSWLMDGVCHLLICGMLITACVNGVRRRRAGLDLLVLTERESVPPTEPAPEGAEAAETAWEADEAFAETDATTAHSDATEQEAARRDTKWE